MTDAKPTSRTIVYAVALQALRVHVQLMALPKHSTASLALSSTNALKQLQALLASLVATHSSQPAATDDDNEIYCISPCG